jgi:hypothetical protein
VQVAAPAPPPADAPAADTPESPAADTPAATATTPGRVACS